MASSNDYLIYVLELLREIRGITYKKMMGEYLLYKDGIIFGGIFDNRFLIKKCHKYEGVLKEQIPYPNAKPMLLVDSEDPDVIKEMVLEVLKEIKSSEEKDKKATLLKEISIKLFFFFSLIAFVRALLKITLFNWLLSFRKYKASTISLSF